MHIQTGMGGVVQSAESARFSYTERPLPSRALVGASPETTIIPIEAPGRVISAEEEAQYEVPPTAEEEAAFQNELRRIDDAERQAIVEAPRQPLG